MKKVAASVIALAFALPVSAESGFSNVAPGNTDLYGYENFAQVSEPSAVQPGFGDLYGSILLDRDRKGEMVDTIHRGTNDAYASPILDNNGSLDW